MAKINRGYLSVRENFRQIWRVKTPEGWEWANPFKTRQFYLPSFRWQLDKFHYGTQFLGVFQPVVDSVFDAADTFMPYKSGKKVGWDLLQPLRGIGNVLEAVGQIVYAPLFLLGKLTIMNISVAITAPKGHKLGYVFGNTLSAFLMPISWILNSIPKFLRGITQIATTPLSWIKMIARGFSTLENRGVQRLVDDRSIVRLVKQGEALQQELVEKRPSEKSAATATTYMLGHTDDEIRNSSSDDDDQPTAVANDDELDKRITKQFQLNAIQRELQKKYDKEVKRTNAANTRERPKRLAHLGQKTWVQDNNWVNFFKSAMVDRKTELQEISRTRFGKSASAA